MRQSFPRGGGLEVFGEAGAGDEENDFAFGRVFHPPSELSSGNTMSTISGLNPTACSLVPSGFGLPLPGLPADFTTDLLAKLWSGGTLAICDHPLGNNVEFPGLIAHSQRPRLTLARQYYVII